MSDDKFTALVKSYKLDQEKTIPPFITLGNVNGILKEKFEQDPFKIFAKIRIDEDALKGDLIDGVMLTNIEELLKQLETSFPYLKIERSGIDEKVESKFFNKVQQKKAMLERQLFSTAIAAKLKNKNKIKGQSQSEFETRYLGMSRQELSQMFFDDPKSAFEYIGYEYDENKIYNDALKAANEWVDSIAQKVHERTPDPFKVANSTMLAA